jgi:beta-galactosidase
MEAGMLTFGVDYYPEQWPEERWPEDVRLMKEAGFNLARLAEFAWSKLEPEENRFQFEWLDLAIDLLAEHGISIILGTPTASPPAWVISRLPDLCRVRADGMRVTYGNRREYCPNHSGYRELARRIVCRMAEHYAGHPAVTGWQIDNEFGERCYCPRCQAAFQTWLKERYGRLDELNRCWGTVFWSHEYTNWDQIPLPLDTGGSPNPGLALDFARFTSDTYVTFQREQVEILRQIQPGWEITHNFMGFGYDQINYFDLAKDLDHVSLDLYPRTQWSLPEDVDPSWLALAHDTMRGLKGKNYWMMEQQAGPGGWEIVSASPQPGELRLWAYQAIAHGADAVVFFRWRTARVGTEQYWHGLLDHSGRTTRRYEEIRRMGQEIQQIGDLLAGAQVKSQVALVLSYDSRFAFQVQANHPEFSYGAHFHELYHAFQTRHIPVDIVPPEANLDSYRLVVAPALHVLPEELAGKLAHFVEDGGVLLATPRTGVKDCSNRVVESPLPGLLREICGVEVEEYVSLPSGVRNRITYCHPALKSLPERGVRIWCDILSPRGALTVARYEEDFFAGKPALTLNHSGKGWAAYLGVYGEQELYNDLAGWLLELARIPAARLTTSKEVEVTERWQGGQRLLFLLNHSGQEQIVSLDGKYANLLDAAQTMGSYVKIPAYEVLILTPQS